ncbi:hypothetical protein TUM22923_05730 [Polynucleobacter sp. TUM22923]|jgi:hypothetical protein|uniref:hypothetical protein n=1 Tax=Polynucleobacter sp. TUM22923 TaxID=3022126 RepID=UPI0025726FB1|nr:hypothetical protein [Polynucleobacter sp. TUM22923]BDX21252.1 hypothetical protein TUM22923_05730 [Polynucleobacter sp. TUM22923]
MTHLNDPAENEDFDYSQGEGRIARFKAARAILNAQIQAKITERTQEPRKIVCHHPPIPPGFFNTND